MKNNYSLPPKKFLLIFLRASLLLLMLIFSVNTSRGQLVVTQMTAQDIVSKLLGCGSAASNITMNCYNGPLGYAAGYFTALNTNLGIDSGILFTTGSAPIAIGPNNSGSDGIDNGTPGNALLQALCGQNTFNACVLDFDVLLNTDTLRFNYAFGSDEYSEWVGTIFNDVFALWLSGPGIVGNQNLAVIPGTPYPVTISNVNCWLGTGGAYYVCNDPANFYCNASYNCPTSMGQTTIEYDGFTKVLEAKQAVIPGQTYHLQFAIADAGDGVWDSGVFVEADFLKQYSVSILSDSLNFINPFDSTLTIVEGCTPGVLHFNLGTPNTDTLYVPIVIGGTATMNDDYTAFNDTLTFLPYDSSEQIFIGAIADGIVEGTETIILYTVDPCSGLALDSLIVNLIDDFPFQVSNDTTVCENTAADLIATFSPFYSYQWEPANFVACDTCSSTTGSPVFTTMFVVGVGLGTCINYDTVEVTVNVITPDAGPDQDLCHGDTTDLFATGGVNYLWSPAAGLSDPAIQNPLAFPLVTTDYIVEAQGTYFFCFDYDTVTINVVPNLVGSAGNDTIICPGAPVELWAEGGDYYLWSPPYNIDDTTSRTPTVSPRLSTVYQVIITNVYDCVDTVEVIVDVFPDPVITLNQPYVIYSGEVAQLFAHGGVNSTYQWSPSLYLSDPNIYNPVASTEVDMIYTVTITTAQGCIFYDTTSVTILHETLVVLPNAFTPNGDGINDEFEYIVRGPFDLDGFMVFDRWGNTIFNSSNINEGWNGSYMGKQAEIGTYVYALSGRDGDGGEVFKKGAFVLVR